MAKHTKKQTIEKYVAHWTKIGLMGRSPQGDGARVRSAAELL